MCITNEFLIKKESQTTFRFAHLFCDDIIGIILYQINVPSIEDAKREHNKKVAEYL